MGSLDSLDDLSEEGQGLILSEIVVLYVVVELSALGHLHDHKDVTGGVQHFVEFDYVRVVDKLEDPDLPLDLPHHTSTFEIMFLFFILDLFRILTATFVPVRSCLASAVTTTVPLTLANPPQPIVLPRI